MKSSNYNSNQSSSLPTVEQYLHGKFQYWKTIKYAHFVHWKCNIDSSIVNIKMPIQRGARFLFYRPFLLNSPTIHFEKEPWKCIVIVLNSTMTYKKATIHLKHRGLLKNLSLSPPSLFLLETTKRSDGLYRERKIKLACQEKREYISVLTGSKTSFWRKI